MERAWGVIRTFGEANRTTGESIFTINRENDFHQADFLRGPSQAESSFGTFDRYENPGPGELLKQFCQKRRRQAFGLGNFLGPNQFHINVCRNIGKRPKGVLARA